MSDRWATSTRSTMRCWRCISRAENPGNLGTAMSVTRSCSARRKADVREEAGIVLEVIRTVAPSARLGQFLRWKSTTGMRLPSNKVVARNWAHLIQHFCRPVQSARVVGFCVFDEDKVSASTRRVTLLLAYQSHRRQTAVQIEHFGLARVETSGRTLSDLHIARRKRSLAPCPSPFPA